MSNPMLDLLNRGAQPSRAPMHPNRAASIKNMNPMQMLREFGKFKKAMQGRNPQQILNKLIESGEMTPEQLEEYKSMAQDLLDFLK